MKYSDKLITFFKENFIDKFVLAEDVTDISYDGDDFFISTSENVRRKIDRVLTREETFDLMRQIANLTNKNFNLLSPILDISFDRYRVLAIHPSIARKAREEVLTFNVRFGMKHELSHDETFIAERVSKLLRILISMGNSLVIAGKSGSGKTELQKLVIGMIDDGEKAILIDNIDEVNLDEIGHRCELWTLVINQELNSANYEEIIKASLRSNADRIILSEIRGKEALYLLTSGLSGHSTITTMHADSISLVYERMTRMCLISGQRTSYEDVLYDIKSVFKRVVMMKKVREGRRVKRMIESISFLEEDGKQKEVFHYPSFYKPLPKSLKEKLEEKGMAIKWEN
jgi:pilus assembly protein CpaF